MLSLRLFALLLIAAAGLSCKKGDAAVTPGPPPETPAHQAAYASSDSRLLVGVCYYPWFTQGQHWGGDNLRTRLTPGQPPELGLYDCAAQPTITRHVRWSAQAGIDFWISSWWGQGSSTDQVILEGQLTNPDFKAGMGYCLLYEPRTGVPIVVNDAYAVRFLGDVRYMMDKHFSHSNYLKIDNKPVLYVYLTRTMQGDWKALCAAADSLARTGGYGGLYMVGDEVYWGHDADAHVDGMEAVTAYNPHTSQLWVVDPVEFVRRTSSELYGAWMTTVNARGKSLWVDVIPGFNDLGVRPEAQHPIISRRDTSTFLTFLEAVKPVLKQQTIPLKVLVVTSWNEWHEDTQIEPTITVQVPTQLPSTLTHGNWYNGYGSRYLDILQQYKSRFFTE